MANTGPGVFGWEWFFCAMARLPELIQHADALLQTREVLDWANAWNGLQVANSGRVVRIVAAVDGCEAVLAQAASVPSSLLVVHHGLFWSGVQPVVGPVYRKLKRAFEADLAVYSAHLPLDLHPRLGNNALLVKALGFKKCRPFFVEKGRPIGLRASVRIRRSVLAERLARVLGNPPHLAAGGPEEIREVGVVTGGAGGEVARAAAEGVDTFITGEGPHHSFTAAEELGVNLFYGGHYATETFGVKALAAELSLRFRVPWEFIDHPTGL